jgi:hypothetical protein
MVELTHDSAAYFELRFSPNVELVTIVRRFVAAFYQRILENSDMTAQLVIATHELVENAVKFAATGETGIRVEANRKGDTPRVRVSTWNTSTAEQVKLVRHEFNRMTEVADAFEYYRMRMRETGSRDDGSGLGLARIRAEAGMDLRLRVDGNTVWIFAETATQLEHR